MKTEAEFRLAVDEIRRLRAKLVRCGDIIKAMADRRTPDINEAFEKGRWYESVTSAYWKAASRDCADHTVLKKP